jgi:hypothetical protein
MYDISVSNGTTKLVKLATVEANDDATLLAKARQMANESYHGEIKIERTQGYLAIVFEPCGSYERSVLMVTDAKYGAGLDDREYRAQGWFSGKHRDMNNGGNTMDELIKAVRADSKVGIGSCTSIDECYEDHELAEMLREAGATTPAEAIKVARETEGLHLEQGLNCRWGEDDDPQLIAWREWNEGWFSGKHRDMKGNNKMENKVTRYTTAPVDYDYSYVETIDHCAAVDSYKETKVWRRIELPSERVEYQTGRYMSGLHPCVDAGEFAKLIDYGLVKTR